MAGITVGAGDLCRALAAVLPHAATDSEDSDFHRVRLSMEGVNLHVIASQKQTVAVALVSVEDHGTGEAGHFDLTPKECRELITLFKPAKRTPEGLDALEVRWNDSEVTCRDIGGFVPGKAATWMTSTSDAFPDVESTVGAAVHFTPRDVPADFALSPHAAHLFSIAGEVYSAPLVAMRRTDHSLLISVGDSFLGRVHVGVPDAPGSPGTYYDEDAWARRLPAMPRWQPSGVTVTRAGDAAPATDSEQPADEGGATAPPEGRHLTSVGAGDPS